MSDAHHEQEELARLTGALAAHLTRRKRRGVERVSREKQVPAPAPAESQETAPQPAPAPPSSAPTAPVPVAAQEPETTEQVSDTRFAIPAALPGKGLDLPPTNREIAVGCADLTSLRTAVAACKACDLCQTRKQTVFQDGDGSNGVLFVGEAPGFNEDASGIPFVGQAGDLLSDIIRKGMHLKREEVAIANVLKCRPPDNRDPSPLEKERCTPFLDRQIELINPRVIIPLGRHASNHILGTQLPMGRLRGRAHDVAGRKVVPTYHPAYLLRTPSMKKECWKDIQLAMRELGQE